ncbi:Latent-Transforming Growth Factor Beta-Binding Protein 1 [Manis pentadactyla]|nr:Latent-Transforming Growth Factor Beta-Binding Protein 1 [Manis pentadactyla]
MDSRSWSLAFAKGNEWTGWVMEMEEQVTRDVETCDLGPRVRRRISGASTRARRVQEEEAAGGPADVTPGVQSVGQRGRGLAGGAGSAASESASVRGESAPTAHRQRIRHGSAGPRDPHRTSTGLEPVLKLRDG